MVNITDVLYNTYWKPYSRSIIIGVLFILFSIMSVMCYYKYVYPYLQKRIYKDITNAERRMKSVQIYYFTVDWCPYCKKAKPVFTDFYNKYNDQVINGYKIEIVLDENQDSSIGIDCTDSLNTKIKQYMDEFHIEHFPTVKMMKEDVSIDFEGAITKNNLDQFIQLELQ